MSRFFLFVFLLLGFCFESWSRSAEWGFYAHRLINRIAVFTLPLELIPFYKANIAFIERHAIDADKRRYASPIEGIRHYIDLDVWEYPGMSLTLGSLSSSIVNKGSICFLDATGDTAHHWQLGEMLSSFSLRLQDSLVSQVDEHMNHVLAENAIDLPSGMFVGTIIDSLGLLDHRIVFLDEFSKHGILPFHLMERQWWLTKAFMDRDLAAIVRHSTDLGHYLADAHVPLHTTRNYDGQLTGQTGIHAFWETRIPELFALESYDLFVDPAVYIERIDSFYWDVVRQSHQHVPEVLQSEKRLSETFRKDSQYCYEERNHLLRRLACRDYAKAYQDELDGMVEDQMRKAIHAIGSAWYTAWINAGAPELPQDALKETSDSGQLMHEDSVSSKLGKILGREHD